MLSLLCSKYFVQDYSSLDKVNLKKFYSPKILLNIFFFFFFDIYVKKFELFIQKSIYLFLYQPCTNTTILMDAMLQTLTFLPISFFHDLCCLYLLYQVKSLILSRSSSTLGVTKQSGTYLNIDGKL